MLNIKNVEKRFGAQVVLDSIDCQIAPKERVIILGQNGAGKTTLLRCILGLYRPDKGEVLIGNLSAIKNRKEFLSRVAFIPQIPPPFPSTVGSLIEFAASCCQCEKKKIYEYGDLFSLDIQSQARKPFSKLSGGMKQKVLASIAFARKAPIMLFDEPTANLDPEGREAFSNIIRSPEFSDTTMVFISHRIDELNTVLNRALWLDLGRIVKDEKISPIS